MQFISLLILPQSMDLDLFYQLKQQDTQKLLFLSQHFIIKSNEVKLCKYSYGSIQKI